MGREVPKRRIENAEIGNGESFFAPNHVIWGAAQVLIYFRRRSWQKIFLMEASVNAPENSLAETYRHAYSLSLPSKNLFTRFGKVIQRFGNQLLYIQPHIGCRIPLITTRAHTHTRKLGPLFLFRQPAPFLLAKRRLAKL